MLYKIPLKYTDKTVILDEVSYQYISEHEIYSSLNLLERLRLHSSGYAVFQRGYKTRTEGYRTDTYYLHKILAEKFVEKPVSEKRLFVSFHNGNPLDCRQENLLWSSMGQINRNQKRCESKSGYRGVIGESRRFRSRIYLDKKALDLGVYETAEEAAEAYNRKSIELFGTTRGLNKIAQSNEAQQIEKRMA